MYGPAQKAAKTSSLCEMVNLVKDNPHPLIIGGDFNMLRFRLRKVRVDLTTVGLFCLMQSLTA